MTDTTLHYENGAMEAGCLAITPLSSHLEGGGDFSISLQQPRGQLQGSHLLLAVPCSDTKAKEKWSFKAHTGETHKINPTGKSSRI